MDHAEVEATSRCNPREEIGALREVVARQERTLMLRDAELATLQETYHKLRRSWPNRTARALEKDLQKIRGWLLGTNPTARYPHKKQIRGGAI